MECISRLSRWLVPALALFAAIAAAACSASPFDCGSDQGAGVACVALPGVSGEVDFDDLWYSAALGRIVVATRDRGQVVLVDPDTLDTRAMGNMGDAGSAADGDGLVLAVDRASDQVLAFDPATGEEVASAATAHRPDYVRYVAATSEVWVTEPGTGVEVFALGGTPPTLGAGTVITTPGGPEGIVASPARGRVYVHGPGGSIEVIAAASRTVEATWDDSCSSSHGLPALDDADGLVLAGCGSGGEVRLLDVDQNGLEVGSDAVGDGSALMAFSATSGHFYARGDPGAPIDVLAAAPGLAVVDHVQGSDSGHCLAADDRGHVWTCDRPGGRLLRIDDPATAAP